MDLVAAPVLALAHVLAGRIGFFGVLPRSRWLSAAAGVSVAYVFLHLLPEIGEAHERAGEEVWLLALGGLGLFYAVEQHSSAAKPRAFEIQHGVVRGLQRADRLPDRPRPGRAGPVHRRARGPLRDQRLRPARAPRGGLRPSDAGCSPPPCWRAGRSGSWHEISEESLGLVVAFIGGGVVLNTIKEELPDDRSARVVPFLLGAGAYAALLALI